MNTAAVGFHCPECVRTGSQKVYRAKDLNSKPVVVFGLIALCVVVYGAQVVSGDGNWQGGEVYAQGVLYGPFVQDGEWWRIITGGFLHAGLIHLGFNMYALYIFGPALHRSIGGLKTGLVYMGGLFAGSAAVLLFNHPNPTLGASGAVLGLAGGLAAVLWARGIKLTQTSLGGLFLINLALPFFSNISFWGHFGGIAGGFVIGWLITFLPQRFGKTESAAIGAAALAILGFVGLAVFGANLALTPVF